MILLFWFLNAWKLFLNVLFGDSKYSFVALTWFQIYDTGNIHSINICEVCILYQWHANGRSMGEKGSVHILLGTHQWPCALITIHALLHSYLPVSVVIMVLHLYSVKLWLLIRLLISGTTVSRCTWFVSYMRPSATSKFVLQIMYATEKSLPTWMNVFQMLQQRSSMCEFYTAPLALFSWLHYKNCRDLHFTVFRSDATCIICREEMTTAKKLLCGHLFHVHCLRSWLERQHTCPTCRAPIIPPDNGRAASARQHGAQPGVQPGEAHFIDLILVPHSYFWF